ncbi:probable cyclic nucleotide-gated ion channel 14 isoform X1 [Cucurbita moschata]|uniref:Probable cyclic nucleotide-gated ion channel 14 isoform X1 n=1 Tax=Cucurbita moschata TaxID=3662 RepID=A0A6J1FS71_CUCMO|nr:probable cyclic nucleotide-gated ion channel 14 isoform X1 [Cucurbita moschata]
MELKKGKFVRFYSNEKKNLELPWEKNDGKRRFEFALPFFKMGTAPLTNAIGDKGKISSDLGRFKIFVENNEAQRKWILNPESETILRWNRVFLFSCLTALFVDPLFFYLPSVIHHNRSSCMTTDFNLGIAVTVFRTFADVFYLFHMVLKFRMAYVSPTSRVFGKGELVTDPKKIAKRYLTSDFCIDLIASLPLPQIMIWFIMPAIRSSHADHTNNTLVLIVLLQYIPRFYLIFPLSSHIIKTTGVVTKTAWAGAAYNLVLYMLASHILGAAWYLLSVERHAMCWKFTCRREFSPTKCHLDYLDCGTLNDVNRRIWEVNTTVFTQCSPDEDVVFNYGIFANAISKNVISFGFAQKYFYCLWWGLQNLSSYGQGLETSTFIGETSFAILIAIMGLVLFAHLIGNMQTYLQSITVRLEEWRVKRRDTEEWMNHRQLPEDLQERVRRFVQYKWLATRGVDEESILQALPTDLRRDIQRHLCLDLVRRVPFFAQMDDQLLDAICERLASSLCTQGTFIVREGDPVTEMFFIIRGMLESSTTDGGRSGFFNSITLRPGDFCGEELLAWALLPKSSISLPSSTRTVRAITEVEAFALRAEDLKFVANQFRRLHSKKLQHTFRFYSYHWRTWAACFIQAAWRRFKRRIIAKTLSIQESFSLNPKKPMADEAELEEEEHNPRSNYSQAKQNLGVTILASRFAANTRRGAQKLKDVNLMKLRKPDEPDFSEEPDD